ncbi:MAG: circadian clock protein KaiC [Halochromatium sp.]
MSTVQSTLPKAPTGIQGLDEITGGGLPRGRPTLICGAPGCGKTLFSMEFLVRGATEFGEPGVFMAFEETVPELTQNVASLGFDLDDLAERGLLALDFVAVERSDFGETGDFDLSGLFVRLGYAIDTIGAKRVVLDTIEILFTGLPNPSILRAELRRLFRWLKDKGVTAVITAERGDGQLTRQGIEEYVSDCVITLDHQERDLVWTRRLRVLKYRGSSHGTNDYPFLIDEDGLSVLPITSVNLDQTVTCERISTGIARLDTMLGDAGYYRGSSVLVSGTAGTGKSSLSAHFADATCRRGEHVLYFAFEESPSQIIRNMGSIGLDLGQWVEQDRLRFHAARPTLAGLETHLTLIQRAVAQLQPSVVILDPINSFIAGGNQLEVKAMLTRLIDFLKHRQITGLFTNLTSGGMPLDATDSAISSLIDTWLLLIAVDTGGERNRLLSILKSRGMAHSNQTREFLITAEGISLRDVYVGPNGVLTGSARIAQEAAEQVERLECQREIEHYRRDLAQRRALLEAHIAALQQEFQARETETLALIEREQRREAESRKVQASMASSRRADTPHPKESL